MISIVCIYFLYYVDVFNFVSCGPSIEKTSILKFDVLRKGALKLLHLPFPVFLNLGNDKQL